MFAAGEELLFIQYYTNYSGPGTAQIGYSLQIGQRYGLHMDSAPIHLT